MATGTGTATATGTSTGRASEECTVGAGGYDPPAPCTLGMRLRIRDGSTGHLGAPKQWQQTDGCDQPQRHHGWRS
jgi:hypothetical protein